MVIRMIADLVSFLDDATADFRVSFQVSTDQKESCRNTMLRQFRQLQRSVLWIRPVIKGKGDLLFLGPYRTKHSLRKKGCPPLRTDSIGYAAVQVRERSDRIHG